MLLEATALTGATAVASAAFMRKLRREVMKDVGVTVLDGGASQACVWREQSRFTMHRRTSQSAKQAFQLEEAPAKRRET